MKLKHLRFGIGFHVALGNRRAQAAAMTLAPGDAEGGPQNRHRGADQWLYVVSGSGVVRANGKSHRIRPGSLCLIAAGDRHEVRNTGKTPLRTLNIYAPPAYTTDGDELPAGKP